MHRKYTNLYILELFWIGIPSPINCGPSLMAIWFFGGVEILVASESFSKSEGLLLPIYIIYLINIHCYLLNRAIHQTCSSPFLYYLWVTCGNINYCFSKKWRWDTPYNTQTVYLPCWHPDYGVNKGPTRFDHWTCFGPRAYNINTRTQTPNPLKPSLTPRNLKLHNSCV